MTVIMAKRRDQQLAVQVDPDVAEILQRLGRRLSVASHGYAQTFVDGQVTLLHRWIMGCTPGDGTEVDHKNGDRLDCRRSNLRVGTRAHNRQNRLKTTARSGYRGVYPCKGRWQARAKQNGIQHHLGTYDTPEQAAAVAAAWRSANMPGYIHR